MTSKQIQYFRQYGIIQNNTNQINYLKKRIILRFNKIKKQILNETKQNKQLDI